MVIKRLVGYVVGLEGQEAPAVDEPCGGTWPIGCPTTWFHRGVRRCWRRCR